MKALSKVLIEDVKEETAPGGNRRRSLVHPDVTGNKHCQLTLLRMLPGHEFPKHFHPNADDVMYILKGCVIFTIGEKRVEAKQGDVIVVPEGVQHSATNATESDVEILVFQAPLPEYKFVK